MFIIFVDMRKKKLEPRVFKHQALIDEYNDMMIRVKTHLFDLSGIDREKITKPTVEELDYLMFKMMIVLKEDNKPMVVRIRTPKFGPKVKV